MAKASTQTAKKAAKTKPEKLPEEDLDDDLDLSDFDDDEDDGLPPPMNAADLQERVQMPRSPGSNVQFDVMIDWLYNVCSEEQRNQCEVYVYRNWPIIMRELDPNNMDPQGKCAKWIDCIQFPYKVLDREYITGLHGGGKYTFWVNVVWRSEQSSAKTVFKSYLDIPITEAEPVLNYKELVTEDPKNKSYVSTLRNKGILDGGNNLLEPKQTSSDPMASVVNTLVAQISQMNSQRIAEMQRNAPNDAAIQKAIDLAATGGQRSLDFMLAMLKDKKDPLETVIQLVSLINATKPKETEGISTKDLLIMMQESRKEQADMFRMMLEMQRGRIEDKEEKQSIASLVGDIKAIKGLGDSLTGGGSWWQEAAPFLAQSIGEGFKLVNTIVGARMGRPQQGVQAQARTAPASKPGNPSQPNNQPSEATQEIQQMQLPEGIDPSFVQQYGMLLVKSISKGESGDILADKLCDILSEAEVSKVQEMGADNLVMTMQAFPEYWNMLMSNFGEKAVVRFVQEFCEYDPNVEDAADGQTSQTT